jgi:hypothetical protein
MGFDMVAAALGIVFGDDDEHMLPPGGAGQELDDAAEGEVVIGP